ncbi:hypothetical protein AJ88_03885 [Mesorhizobium amorphae CCBAU 01583]|nr:hypothetical protein AJ88_03885 [Mesorhizobium amorphae CCBAU 01583]
MPIVQYPEDRPALGTFGAVDYKPAQEAEVAPDIATLLGASFRQDNTVGSMASNKLAGVDMSTREDGFTGDLMWDKIKATPYAQHWDRFANVFNTPAFEAMKAQIDMETEDRRTIDAAGWWGTGASVLAGGLDLPSLIPGGALVRKRHSALRCSRVPCTRQRLARLALACPKSPCSRRKNATIGRKRYGCWRWYGPRWPARCRRWRPVLPCRKKSRLRLGRKGSAGSCPDT